MVNPYEWPNVDNLVVCSVKNVKNYGAFVTLDEYADKEGFIHIAEIASGWVKYIRNYIREGTKVVCKVLKVVPARGHIDLSLKRVNSHQKRAKIQEWRSEKKAEKLFELVVGKLGKDLKESYRNFGFPLVEEFGSLYAAFEAVTINRDALKEASLEGEWGETFIDVAVKNITPPFVTISCVLELFSPVPNGIEHIREALKLAQDCDEAEITTTYIGAPNYRIAVRAPNYKVAEDALATSTKRAIDHIEKNKGFGYFERSR